MGLQLIDARRQTASGALLSKLARLSSLSGSAPHVTWLHIVLLADRSDAAAWDALRGRAASVGAHAAFRYVLCGTPCRSKWQVYRGVIDDVAGHPFVLLMDDSIHPLGFPILEFLSRVHGAFPSVPVVSGVPFGDPTDPVAVPTGPRPHLHPSDAAWWHHETRAGIRAAPVDVVEWAFALVDGGFFAWYIRELESARAGADAAQVDAVLDHAWCAAAKVYAPGNVSCAIFPLPVLEDPDAERPGPTAGGALAGRLGAWVGYSRRYRGLFRGPWATAAPDDYNNECARPVTSRVARPAPRVRVSVNKMCSMSVRGIHGVDNITRCVACQSGVFME